MSEYSRKQLTEPLDKLPALSSITSYFAARTNQHYAAGMWLENIRYELLWNIRLPSNPLVNIYGDKHTRSGRLGEWKAPTWSWLSLENVEVSFPDPSALDFSPAHDGVDLLLQSFPVTQRRCHPKHRLVG